MENTDDISNIKIRNKVRILSQETKRKMSISNTGRKHTEETKLKISLSKKGKKLSDELKTKRLELFKNKISPLKGRTLPEETKAKISKALKGRKMSDAHKEAIAKVNTGKVFLDKSKAAILDTKYIKKLTVPVIVNGVLFKSLRDAAKHLDISHVTVKHRCASENFYGWKFVDRDSTKEKG